MGNRTSQLLPFVERRLVAFGERLRLARLRRRLTAKQVAERAGMSLVTLRALERGSAGATIGAYLSVMHVLGVDGDIDLLASSDAQGREIQDARLPRRRPSRATRTLRFQAPLESPASVADETRLWRDAGDFVGADELAQLLRHGTKRGEAD